MSTYLNPVTEEVAVVKKTVIYVPIFRKSNSDTFVVWTGEGSVKYFTNESLPDCIKVPLGIVMNSPKAAELNQKDMSEMDMSKNVLQEEVFKAGSGWPIEYKDIGWQYNKYYYVVVLSKDELEIVRKSEAGKEKPEAA